MKNFTEIHHKIEWGLVWWIYSTLGKKFNGKEKCLKSGKYWSSKMKTVKIGQKLSKNTYSSIVFESIPKNVWIDFGVLLLKIIHKTIKSIRYFNFIQRVIE